MTQEQKHQAAATAAARSAFPDRKDHFNRAVFQIGYLAALDSPPAPGWVSVGKEMPSKDGVGEWNYTVEVLVTDGKKVTDGFHDSQRWQLSDFMGELGPITHWMLKPPPPAI